MSLRKWVVLAVVFSLVLLVDQLSKAWVLANMQIGETILLIPSLHPYFQLTFSTNTGAAFGFLPTAGGVFLVVAALISCLILYFYWQTPSDARLMQVGLSLVLGGAVGNVIDRLQHGYVVDFVHLVLPGVISNVSNFADHAIVLGVLCLLIDSFRRERAQRRLKREATLDPNH